MPHRVIAVVTDVLEGDEPVKEMIRTSGEEVELRVVVPAVEANPVRHTLGDIDEPREQARERLQLTLRNLREAGVEASGEIGDPDPVQAAQDELLKAPADEILIFEYEEGQQRWYEGGLFEHAKESLEPPLRMVVLERERSGGEEKVVDVETDGAGTISGVEHEVGSSYLPGLSRAQLGGMIAGIVGTIATIILAAAIAGESGGPESGWKAVAIGIAIFTALINMAHVVGLLLMESVRYRGGFAKFFRTLSLVGTPLAVLINLGILIFS